MRRTRKSPSAGRKAIRSKVSVIIPIMNERKTLPAVLHEVKKLQSNIEIIAVVNGSTDGSASIAGKSGARVVLFNQPLGHDVGRSIGRLHASGDILLFLDGDFVIPARQLLPYLRAVESGVDIALNQIQWSGAQAYCASGCVGKACVECGPGPSRFKGSFDDLRTARH